MEFSSVSLIFGIDLGVRGVDSGANLIHVNTFI